MAVQYRDATNYTLNNYSIDGNVTITSEEPVLYSDSITLKRQIVSQNAQRWVLEFGVAADVGGDLYADLVTNKTGTFTMAMPQLRKVAYNSPGQIAEGYATVDVTTSATAAVGDTSVAVTSDQSGNTHYLTKGTFFKFSNSDKIYITTSTTDLSSGSATMNFFPALRASIDDTVEVELGQYATFTGRLDPNDMIGITYNDGVVGRIDKIRLVEVV